MKVKERKERGVIGRFSRLSVPFFFKKKVFYLFERE